MALGHAGADAFLVVATIAGERGHHAGGLIKQEADLGAVVDFLGRERDGNDLAAASVQGDVQLAPAPARPAFLLLQQPLARAGWSRSGPPSDAAPDGIPRAG